MTDVLVTPSAELVAGVCDVLAFSPGRPTAKTLAWCPPQHLAVLLFLYLVFTNLMDSQPQETSQLHCGL